MGFIRLNKTRNFMYKVMAVFSVLNLLFSYVTPVAAADTVQVSYNVTYGQTEARSMLGPLNEWRTGSTWYWNADDETKTTIEEGELKALVYDSSLEKIAMQRAAETVLRYSHTRPNGKSWSTVYSGFKCGDVRGENIACGQTSAESVLRAWIEEDELYDNQGHRRNMLYDKYNYIGIGHIKYQGVDFWVQEFSNRSDNQNIGTANDSDVEVAVEVANSEIAKKGVALSKDSCALVRGESDELPTANSYISLGQASCRRSGEVYILGAPVTWTTSDESIVRINGNKMTAVGIGTVKLTAKAVVIGTAVESAVTVMVKNKESSSSAGSNSNNMVESIEKTSSRSNKSSGGSGGGGGGGDADDEDDDSTSTSSSKENIKLTSDTGTEQLSYQVTSKKSKTVAFAGVSKKATAVTVPATIKYNNKKYKVTSIKEKAFKGRAKLKNIELNGNNIRSVGDGAFKGIKKNVRITITAKNKKQYNKVVRLIKESETGKVKYVYKKKS